MALYTLPEFLLDNDDGAGSANQISFCGTPFLTQQESDWLSASEWNGIFNDSGLSALPMLISPPESCTTSDDTAECAATPPLHLPSLTSDPADSAAADNVMPPLVLRGQSPDKIQCPTAVFPYSKPGANSSRTRRPRPAHRGSVLLKDKVSLHSTSLVVTQPRFYIWLTTSRPAGSGDSSQARQDGQYARVLQCLRYQAADPLCPR